MANFIFKSNDGTGVDNVVISGGDSGDAGYAYESFSSTQIKAYDDSANYILLAGYGFTRDAQGSPNAGTVTTIKYAEGGLHLVAVTGLAISISTLSAVTNDPEGFSRLLMDGSDQISLTQYADSFRGGNGNDKMFGSKGNDILYGDDGNDSLSGEDDADKLFGGTGNDSLYGGFGNDYIVGSIGSDHLSGQFGSDKLDGGAQNDTLLGGLGADILNGGLGADRFVYNAAAEGNDVVKSFAADDTFVFKGSAFKLALFKGVVKANFFIARDSDNQAQDFNDFFIFRRSDDTLWFDSDGNRSAADPVKIADLANNFGLSHTDIVIV